MQTTSFMLLPLDEQTVFKILCSSGGSLNNTFFLSVIKNVFLKLNIL